MKDGSARFSADGVFFEPPNPDPALVKANLTGGKRQGLPDIVYAARVSIVAALKQEGYSRPEIADALDMSVSGVDWCLRKARERNLITQGLAAAVQELDNEALPLAVESLIHHLKEKDKDVTIKTLQGRGAFLTKGSGAAGNGGMNMAFQFNFVTPDGAPAVNPAELTGKILGTPKTT